MGLTSLSVVCAVLVLNVHHRGRMNTRPPAWLLRFVYGWPGRLVGLPSPGFQANSCCSHSSGNHKRSSSTEVSVKIGDSESAQRNLWPDKAELRLTDICTLSKHRSAFHKFNECDTMTWNMNSVKQARSNDSVIQRNPTYHQKDDLVSQADRSEANSGQCKLIQFDISEGQVNEADKEIAKKCHFLAAPVRVKRRAISHVNANLMVNIEITGTSISPTPKVSGAHKSASLENSPPIDDPTLMQLQTGINSDHLSKETKYVNLPPKQIQPNDQLRELLVLPNTSTQISEVTPIFGTREDSKGWPTETAELPEAAIPRMPISTSRLQDSVYPVASVPHEPQNMIQPGTQKDSESRIEAQMHSTKINGLFSEIYEADKSPCKWRNSLPMEQKPSRSLLHVSNATTDNDSLIDLIIDKY
ncbi:unnamed protein product, partial [Protopolystoma xenopodis]